MNNFLTGEAVMTSPATIRQAAGTRGEYQGGHGVMIFASAVLAVPGFSNLLAGIVYDSRQRPGITRPA